MRHLKAGRRLARNAAERRSLYRNMVTSLFKHERITTTVPKAKELRRFAERVVTLCKRGVAKSKESKNDALLLAARRRARVWVNDRDVLRKLFDDIAERYAERPGGYTRIVKVGPRLGDNAPMAIIELMPGERKAPPPPPEPEPKGKGKKKLEAAAEAKPAAEAKAKGKAKGAAKVEDAPPAETPKRTRKKKGEDEE
jgi:large subunit ribosomal protein L17